jgi:methylated-DNA-[protein]-cysteine S-methyltransferase
MFTSAFVRYLPGTGMNAKLIDETPFGTVALAWYGSDRPVISDVLISSETRSARQRAMELYPEAGWASCAEVDQTARHIAAYLAGDPVEFALDLLDLDQCGPFHRRVLLATHGISRGFVASYGGVAAHLGCPGGARAVGNAMATNPFPLIIPCHRVVRSDFTLGSYGGGVEMKRALLEQEGVVPDGRGRIPSAQVMYRS